MTNQEPGTLAPRGADRWRIHFVRRLPHDPAEVWSALTVPAEQQRWLPGVTIEPTEGAPITFDFGDDDRAEGEVLAVDRGRLLEHTWLWPDEPESTVRWTLTPAPGGTTLELHHEPVRHAPAPDHLTGWHTTLDALALHLAGADPATLTPDYDHLHTLYN